MDAIKNFAKAIVDGNYDSSATSIDVAGGHGARLPAVSFNAVWWNITDYPDPSDDPGVEIVRVTAISTDTLTITRAQEGTAAGDHNVAGKTYALVAGLTARTITDMLGDVFGSGTAVLVDTVGDTIELRQSASSTISLAASNTVIENTGVVELGDPIGNGNSSFVSISDGNQRFTLVGMDLATDRTASASGPVGTVVAKLAVRDGSGTVIGYLPIYDSIT
jgi:hypothetical protein